MLALALNRRGAGGDQDRAIAVMEKFVAETGGDAESFGVLGRIYKERYEAARASKDPNAAATNLESALRCYRSGFELNPKDYYTGLNVVMLLLQRVGGSAHAELANFLPRVRAAVKEKIDTGRPDFWDLTTQMQLAVVAGDWEEAERAGRQASVQADAGWMLDSVRRDLRQLADDLPDVAQGDRARQLNAVLADPAIAEAGNA